MSRFSQLMTGFRKLMTGFGTLLSHPSLWPWVLVPWMIALLLLVAGWWLFTHYFGDFSFYLLSKAGLALVTKGEGFWNWFPFAGLWLLQKILKILIFMIGILLCSLVSFLFYLIIAAPFLDTLAEKVTLLFLGESPPDFQWKRFARSIGQSVVVELKKVLLFLLVPVLFWVLNFIPVIGSLVYLVLTVLFGMWTLGFSTVDYPMGHQLIPFGGRLKFARKNKFALIGFGAPFLIPFAPLFLQAPMVVGGTLLYHELKEKKELP